VTLLPSIGDQLKSICVINDRLLVIRHLANLVQKSIDSEDDNKFSCKCQLFAIFFLSFFWTKIIILRLCRSRVFVKVKTKNNDKVEYEGNCGCQWTFDWVTEKKLPKEKLRKIEKENNRPPKALCH
jgi:hypothetical protein